MDDEYTVEEIKKELKKLPKGTLVYKTINGIKQPYLQMTVNGKSISKYIKKADREWVLKEIEKRKDLEFRLSLLMREKEYSEYYQESDFLREKTEYYGTDVITGDYLKKRIDIVKEYKKRTCYKMLDEYLYDNTYSRVFILYGLRRTGKTTLMHQAILSMNEDDFNKTAYILIKKSDIIEDLNKDLRTLLKNGYKYVFIDEVTLLDDFIEGAAIFSDLYSACGMKIILSGTDSLGFYLSEGDALYDRTIMAHTTFISYAEFENVLGIKGIDNYIKYGGLMSFEDIHYNNDSLFDNMDSIDEYLDSAIAHNIQHSLKNYEYGYHFRHLKELYNNGELTSAINRVVEDMSHEFTMEVLTNPFISHDYGISRNNLRNETGVLEKINKEELTLKLKNALEILNKNEQKVNMEDIHRKEIEEYLSRLDLVKYIDKETIPSSSSNERITVITQPGIRYSQAKILIKILLMDQQFEMVNDELKKEIISRILNEIKGRMMEEIILLETSLKYKKKRVFKLEFDRGEFDMVVSDNDISSIDIYEFKHSDKIIPEQCKNLIDEEKLKMTEFKFGHINKRYVIYRGEYKELDNGIIYLNVEDYLKGLD